MQTALRVTTRVLPGHRVEIIAPELTDGDAVEVFVVLPQSALPLPVGNPMPAERPVSAEKPESLMAFLDSLPPGPRSAPTWEEIERTLQEEKDAWDR